MSSERQALRRISRLWGIPSAIPMGRRSRLATGDDKRPSGQGRQIVGRWSRSEPRQALFLSLCFSDPQGDATLAEMRWRLCSPQAIRSASRRFRASSPEEASRSKKVCARRPSKIGPVYPEAPSGLVGIANSILIRRSSFSIDETLGLHEHGAKFMRYALPKGTQAARRRSLTAIGKRRLSWPHGGSKKSSPHSSSMGRSIAQICLRSF